MNSLVQRPRTEGNSMQNIVVNWYFGLVKLLMKKIPGKFFQDKIGDNTVDLKGPQKRQQELYLLI